MSLKDHVIHITLIEGDLAQDFWIEIFLFVLAKGYN